MLNRKSMILIIVLILSNLIIFANVNITVDNIKNSRILASCEGLTIDEAVDRLANTKNRLLNKNIRDTVDLYSADIKLFREIGEYQESVENVFKNADKMLKMSRFNQNNSFSKDNINKTVRDYEKLRGKKVEIINSVSADIIIQHRYAGYLACIAGIIIIFNIMAENDCGMDRLVYTYRNGRRYLAIKRIIMLFVIEAVILAIMYCSMAVMSYSVFGGMNNLMSSARNLSSCRYLMMDINILGYMCINYLAEVLVVCSILIVIYGVCVIINNRKAAISGIGIILGIEYVLYNRIDARSSRGFLKTFNIINLFDYGSDVMGVYKNYNLFEHAVSLSGFMACVMISVIIISTVIIIIYSGRHREHERRIRIKSILVQFNQRVLSKLPVGAYEFYKVMVSSKGVIITIIIMLINSMFFYYFRNIYNNNATYADEMYIEYGGEDYTYFEQYVDEFEAEKKELMTQMEELGEEYINDPDNMDKQINYNLAMNTYGNLIMTRGDIAQEFHDKIINLKQLKAVEGIDGEMMPERCYNSIFGKNSIKRVTAEMIIILLGMAMILLDSFDMELRSRMSDIIISCRYGRTYYYAKKIITNMIFILIALIVFGVQEIMDNSVRYGYPSIDAPVKSLIFMSDTVFNWSVRQWIIMVYVVRIIYIMAICVIVMVIPLIYRRNNSRNIMSIVCIACISAGLLFGIVGYVWQCCLMVAAVCMAVIVTYKGYVVWCNR